MNSPAPSRLSDKQMALLLAAMAAVMPFSIDTYLPAVPAMAASLGVGETDIQQSLSIFLVGQSAGVLLGGVFSDFKGRRPVVLAGLGVYLVASLGLILLQTLPQLMLLRMLQAFGAGMVAVSGGAIVRDHYEGRRAAQIVCADRRDYDGGADFGADGGLADADNRRLARGVRLPAGLCRVGVAAAMAFPAGQPPRRQADGFAACGEVVIFALG